MRPLWVAMELETVQHAGVRERSKRSGKAGRRTRVAEAEAMKIQARSDKEVDARAALARERDREAADLRE